MNNLADRSGGRGRRERSFGREMVANSWERTSRQFIFSPCQIKLSLLYLSILKAVSMVFTS